jgi:L-malate glycosyltransferase
MCQPGLAYRPAPTILNGGQSMNVLHLISGGEVGGSKNILLALVKGMGDSEVKNIIVCFIRGRLYEEAVEMGLDVRLLEQRKRFDLSIVSRIMDICENENINIVNCHGGRANFVGYFLKRKYRAKYVTTVHSDYKEDYKGNKYKTLIYSNINRMALNAFDYYITVSDNFKDMLINRGFDKDKIFVVYNGIDFKREGNDFNKKDIIENYNLKDAGQYVTMVARFHPVKGHRVFLEACKAVLENFKDVCFILVGDGAVKNEMEEYARELSINESVKFVGFQKPDDFLGLSSFTVLTSFTESFPLAILESAAYKKTVVSTDVGGISRLIKDGENGYLVKPGDSLELACRMVCLLKNPDTAAKFGERLYGKASKNYSLESFTERYLEIYNSVLAGRDK